MPDDGIGLPCDYDGRAHEFANMRAVAGRLGESLIVEPQGRTAGQGDLRDAVGPLRKGGIGCCRSPTVKSPSTYGSF